MPSQANGAGSLRKGAVTDLKGCQLKLMTIGSQLAEAINLHTDNVFGFLGNLLAEDSSPASMVRDGIASGIQCFKTQADLWQGIGGAVCGSAAGSSAGYDKPTPTVRVGGTLPVELDQFAEASDPAVIEIPADLADALKPKIAGVGTKPILEDNINLSLSSDGKRILVSLTQLKTARPSDRTGKYYSAPGKYGATLTWSNGAWISIAAVVR